MKNEDNKNQILKKQNLQEYLFFDAKIISNASKNEILGWENKKLKIKIKEKREKQKANKELIFFLSKALNIKKKDIFIIKGKTSNIKKIKIENLSEKTFQIKLKTISKKT